MSAVAAAGAPADVRADTRLPRWWPLAALIVLAAALRLSTLDLQSFWYDEAFTPVHVLHASLSATWRAIVHSENTPPLWYLIEWADARVLGTGEVALRLPSALAGVATVPVMWAIGAELAGRRAALIAAALTAVNPLFVWYSQEARAYGLFVLMAALAMLCFLRAEREPTRARMAVFALSGSLALLTHYFAVFLLAPMVLWLLWNPKSRRAALPAIGALAIVGLALLPLISAQGGHGTQWIGRWALSSRLQAIPQYFLTGYSGAPLGHGIELLVALPILAGLVLGLWCMFDRPPPPPSPSPSPPSLSPPSPWPSPSSPPAPSPSPSSPLPSSPLPSSPLPSSPLPSSPSPSPSRPSPSPSASPWQPIAPDSVSGAPRDPRRGALIALLITVVAVLAPIVLAAFGADYLAPRNLVGAMIPLSALIAVMLAATDRRDADGRSRSPAAARAGTALAAAICLAFLAVSIDVDLSPRLQRGNWRDVAKALRGGSRGRAITTVELGAAPLEYYLPPLHNLPRHDAVTVNEIDETGYAPLRRSAGRPPAPGFTLLDRRDVDGLIIYRFVSPAPRAVSEARLRRRVITLAHPEVLVPASARVSTASAHVATAKAHARTAKAHARTAKAHARTAKAHARTAKAHVSTGAVKPSGTHASVVVR